MSVGKASLFAAGVLTWAVAPSVALACFTYFEDVADTTSGEDPGAVLAHRMVLARTSDETVLWDQVVYRGAPDDFVWVMPLPEGATIDVGDDAFFDALTLASGVRLETSWATCTGDTATRGEDVTYDGTIARRPVEVPDAVDLHVSEIRSVGPYELLTLSGDAEEVVAWLIDHDYPIPEGSADALRRYAPSHFVVARLAPGEGADRTAPLRMRIPDATFEVPIPLAVAGAEQAVDLDLFLLGDARLAVTHYENGEVDRDRLVYDPDTLRFNYAELFEMAVHPSGEQSAAWVTEVAGPVDLARLAAYRAIGPHEEPHDPTADVAVLQELGTTYLTRVRTRLEPAQLDRDLGVTASMGSTLSGSVRVDRLAHPTHCMPYDAGARGVPHVCGDPICIVDECTCSAQRRSSRGAWAALLPIAVLWLRRRRR